MRTLAVCLCLFFLTMLDRDTTVRAQPSKSSGLDAPNVTHGIDARQAWTSSRVHGFPDPSPQLKLVRVYPNIEIPNLIALNAIPDSKYLLAIDHQSEYGGPSRVVQFLDEPTVNTTNLFLERPEIIYGLAFHPRFESNRYIFVGCNGRSNRFGAVATRVLRFEVMGHGPFRCDPDSLKVIIEWQSNGHNGGDVAFGGDGMLYVSTGDGSSDSDVARNGQNLRTLAGSILRIDVDATDDDQLYVVPEDNPFVQHPGARPEIWAYGLRNPWRISYDFESNQLWAGNNGQDQWESVYLIERGANYGWSIRESNHPFHTDQDPGPVPISGATAEHHHGEARSLTGGLVYRGKRFRSLAGSYIYGDYSTGNIWALRHDGTQVVFHERIARSNAQISGFGVDHSGEVLVADHAGGIYRFSENNQTQTHKFPLRLSQTGLFENVAQANPEPGVIPYSVNSVLWSDGASKERWLAVPDEETITYKARGSWEFPEGTVLVKSFAFPFNAAGNLRRVETRLLAKQQGEWYGYSYRWNNQQTDAILVQSSGEDVTLDWTFEDGSYSGIRWRFPSRTDCVVCHTRAANFVLGLSTEQMNKTHAYPTSEGYRVASQLKTLEHIGMFGESNTPIETPSQTLVDPFDTSHALDVRARSYLHANCASCHVMSGGGNSKIVLSYFQELNKMNLIDAPPLHGSLETSMATLVKTGDSASSILIARISRRGPGQMPPLATHRVDEAAVKLLAEWIQSLQ